MTWLEMAVTFSLILNGAMFWKLLGAGLMIVEYEEIDDDK